MTACVSPFASTADPEPVDPLPRELAARPEPFEAGEAEELAVAIPSPTPEPTPEAEEIAEPEEDADQGEEAGGKKKRKKKKKNKPPPEPSPKPSPTPSPQPSPAGGPAFRVVGSASDGPGDAGLQAPGYADLLGVSLAEQGTTAIVTVDLAGTVPQKLANGEVMGIGVDLYLSGGGESDYQLFADGGSEGWFAYLQGPSGFVDYPGAFRLAGTRIVFEVPWSSLGAPTQGSFSSFVDWSQKATPINKVGQDQAPNSGTAGFSR